MDKPLRREEAQAAEEPDSSRALPVAQDWITAHKDSIKNIFELSRFIALSESEKAQLQKVASGYQMRITSHYFSLIKNPYDPYDPIKMQCVPSVEETAARESESIDPLGEEKTSPEEFLVHRYPDRVLLVVTSKCFMYCRHCTRKRLWREKSPEPTLRDIDKALSYVMNNRQIREVIVSGGDPLTLPTEKLDYILAAIAKIPHIEVVRIGTRAPVVLPQRIDDVLCKTLGKYEKLWINIQFNHPLEVTDEAAVACRKLQREGIPLSNQSVLLKGINDDPEVMKELCHKLQSIRVRPYYLFQCDPVVGASHFRTAVKRGVEIVAAMRGYTSGMCVPTFVVDGTNGRGKVVVCPETLLSASDDDVLLRDYRGGLFSYESPERENSPLNDTVSEKIVRTVGIVFNLKKSDHAEDEEEYDEVETIESIKKEVEKCGFQVKLFEQGADLTDNLRKNRPDFVLNIAEGVGRSRSREAQVPALLESLGIPYSGSDPVALGITLDKYLTGRLLKSADVPVPLTFMVEAQKEMHLLENIFQQNAKFIVKPRWEGSSKGVFLNSLVDNFADLEQRAAYIFSRYRQPAVVEEFIEKDEITAAVYGNETPRVLGMMKIVPKEESGEPFLYSLEIKRDWQAKVKYERQSSISAAIQKSIEKYALTAYRVLELKDIARIDFRVGCDDVPRIIDINPLPGLSPRYSDLPILCRLNGKSYPELVKTILREAFKRYGFKWQ
jgi:lysine 2,3-aminomutase